MKTLEQQIEDLKKEHTFKSEMESLFGQYKYLAYLNEYKESDKTISIDLKKEPISEIALKLKDITNILKPTNETYQSNDIISVSPYSFWFKSSVNESYVFIGYISNRTAVRIELPINFYDAGIVIRSFRGPSSTEDHYFGGYSRKEMQEVRIPTHKLNIFLNQPYFGGDYLMYITNPEQTEAFNYVVLNGKTN